MLSLLFKAAPSDGLEYSVTCASITVVYGVASGKSFDWLRSHGYEDPDNARFSYRDRDNDVIINATSFSYRDRDNDIIIHIRCLAYRDRDNDVIIHPRHLSYRG